MSCQVFSDKQIPLIIYEKTYCDISLKPQTFYYVAEDLSEYKETPFKVLNRNHWITFLELHKKFANNPDELTDNEFAMLGTEDYPYLDEGLLGRDLEQFTVGVK